MEAEAVDTSIVVGDIVEFQSLIGIPFDWKLNEVVGRGRWLIEFQSLIGIPFDWKFIKTLLSCSELTFQSLIGIPFDWKYKNFPGAIIGNAFQSLIGIPFDWKFWRDTLRINCFVSIPDRDSI